MNDDLKPIGTTPQDLANKVKIPAKVETPPKVDTPDIPDWKLDVSLNFGEKIERFFRSLVPVVTKTLKAISDVAKITTFIQSFWIPIVAVIAILIVLFLLRIL